MIKAITSFKELTILIRKMLLKQSNVNDDNVLNLMSVRGQDLQKLIQDSGIYVSYDLNDSIILFNISKSNSTENVQLDLQNNIIPTYMSYRCHIYVYGNNSYFLAEIIRSRILTQKNLDDMVGNGIKITSCSDIETSRGFINETVWPRSDFDINFSCLYEIKPVDDYEVMDTLSDLYVKEV